MFTRLSSGTRAVSNVYALHGCSSFFSSEMRSTQTHPDRGLTTAPGGLAGRGARMRVR